MGKVSIGEFFKNDRQPICAPAAKQSLTVVFGIDWFNRFKIWALSAVFKIGRLIIDIEMFLSISY